MPTLEKECYAESARELVDRNPAPGLYATAFSRGAGDERKAAAIYLRVRAEQLAEELNAVMAAEAIRRHAAAEVARRAADMASQSVADQQVNSEQDRVDGPALPKEDA
jgi:hypothetical protein